MQAIHLEKRHLVDASASCPLCRFRGERQSLFVVQRNPDVQLVRCPACRGCSASLMPTESYLESYYATFYRSDRSKVTVARPRALARHIARMLPSISGSRLSILDFGGGDGTLAKELVDILHAEDSRRFFRISLIDFNREADEEKDQYSLRHRQDLADLNDGSFDIVLASAILEHVPRAHESLQQLFRVMGEGSVFYARTPFVTPLKRLFRGYPLKYPMHVHDLGPSFWSRVPDRYPGISTRVSQPSFVASTMTPARFLRTSAAYALKLPAHLERRVRRSPKDYYWKWVGGWEVVLQRRSASAATLPSRERCQT